MPRPLRMFSVLLAALLPVLLGACSSSQTVVIREDGSGTLSLHIEVSRVLRDYVASLGEVSGSSGTPRSDRIFDLEAIRKGFQAQPGVSVESLSCENPSVLDAGLSFSSLSAIFARNEGLGASRVVAFNEAGGVKTLTIHLDKANYRQVAVLFPLLESPVLQSLGPQVNDTVSEDDYLEMVRFAIGDEGPALVRKSSVVITVRPEGEIVSQSGGTAGPDGVVFRIPLLRLLVLNSPLDFSVSFR